MVGLDSYNVSFQSIHNSDYYYSSNNNIVNNVKKGIFYYEEYFPLSYGRPMENKIYALERGLPEAMVVVAEYMDTRDGGFQWGE